MAAEGRVVLYASGEESLPQIKSRADRLGVLHDNLLAVATSRVEDLFPLLTPDNAPALIVVDSVQTLASDQADGLPATSVRCAPWQRNWWNVANGRTPP